ncbi:hypothetical protein B0H15DRAFT_608130 [Mycena belliarum]|uniref:Uncharacterized protein n=1 Tax=Mycena belliarum TaxID=1033014 RepID=A0AAD6TQB0_9AGAR|nr:hypothetical protein B0H15DRAFT_608130 [Mycena belliae]
MRPLPTSPRSPAVRPLPSPPTSASSFLSAKSTTGSSFVWPQDSSTYSTPATAQSFAIQLLESLEFPSAMGGRRPTKARRREGRIFTHSPSSSTSSIESKTSCSIISAQFWMAPETVSIPMQAAYLTVTPAADEPKSTPTPKTKPKSKPANIIIPHNTPSATIVSPTATPLPSTPVSFPTTIPGAATTPLTPRSPLSPLLPPTPNRAPHSPNARIRKLAKLKRTLGENIPLELVFPSGKAKSATTTAAAAPLKKAAKQLPPTAPAAVPRAVARLRPSAQPEWPLTPTPDCTIDPAAHAQTAVGLHYALVVPSVPARPRARAPAAAPAPTSPPPFTSTFTMDDVSWERARQAALARGAKHRRIGGGVRKAVGGDNGRGTWRKKESTWSGEWNVEDMEVLQVQLRRLRR